MPALYVDLAKRPGPPTDGTLRREYERAFTGDYSLWIEKPNKVILIDNLSRHVDALKFVEFVRTRFSTIIVTLATDVFYSYYCDDERLADFGEVRIQPLTHGKQEALIRSESNLPPQDSRFWTVGSTSSKNRSTRRCWPIGCYLGTHSTCFPSCKPKRHLCRGI